MKRHTFRWHRLVSDARGITTLEFSVLFLLIAAGALSLWLKFGRELADMIN
jgi:hypothetical protein